MQPFNYQLVNSSTHQLIKKSIGRNIIQLTDLPLHDGGSEELLQVAIGDVRLRVEVVRSHVLQHAAVKLARLGVLRELIERRHTDEQFTLVDSELKDEPELMVALNIVDDLDDGTVLCGSIVEHERTRGFDHGEPLPRCVHVGGEVAEQWVLRVTEYAEGTRRNGLLVVLRDGLEHAVVPVIGLE